MKIAYLLLVHNKPEQAARLIDSIIDDDCSVFIHVDARSDQHPFTELLNTKSYRNQIHFTSNRLKGNWGGFSLVQASLNLLQEAVDHANNYDYFVLLSGQDYPIKSSGSYKKFLQENNGKDFLEYFELPAERLNEKEGGLYRFNRYHYFIGIKHKEFPSYSKKPVLNPLLNSIAKFFFENIRKMPLGMKLYAGSQWWTLQRETASTLLQFLKENKSITKFFNHVWIPDESFFQIVLLHINKGNFINNNYRFIKWGRDVNNILRPETLSEVEFDEIRTSEAFFARKFEPFKSGKLMDMIDEQILKAG